MEDLRSGIASLYRRAIPTNIRLFGERVVGVDSPITEEDFTEEELAYLRELYAKNHKPGERTPITQAYSDVDYETWEGGPIDTLINSYSDPVYNVATSLGAFNTVDTPEGPVIEDIYDWLEPEGANPFWGEHAFSLQDWIDTIRSPYRAGNVLMNTVNPGADRPVRIRLEPPDGN